MNDTARSQLGLGVLYAGIFVHKEWRISSRSDRKGCDCEASTLIPYAGSASIHLRTGLAEAGPR